MLIAVVPLGQTVRWLCRLTVKYILLLTDISRDIARFWNICYRTSQSVVRKMSGVRTFPCYQKCKVLSLYTALSRVWNVGIAPLIPNWTRDGSECVVSRSCRFTPAISHDASVSSECAAPTTPSCVGRTADIQPITNTSLERWYYSSLYISHAKYLVRKTVSLFADLCELKFQHKRARARARTHTHTYIKQFLHVFHKFTKVEPFFMEYSQVSNLRLAVLTILIDH